MILFHGSYAKLRQAEKPFRIVYGADGKKAGFPRVADHVGRNPSGEKIHVIFFERDRIKPHGS